jgi:amidase
MQADALTRLTVLEAARAIAAGRTTAEAIVRACLERIESREPVVGAFAHLAPAAAIAAARARDREPSRGVLHGVPIAIKDVIDTVDLPTGYGSALYADHRPAADAACVALLREAGAIVLGKTVTTEFAAVTPGRTTHPQDPKRSPGGSSSGSAAAVADGMAPAALGTQTVGSTIRPASFCGVTGFKPTFGLASLHGVHAQAQSLDTLGIMARAVDDVRVLAGVLAGAPGGFDAPALDRPPRLLFCPTPHWPQAAADTVRVMDEARRAFAAAGATVVDLEPAETRDAGGADWMSAVLDAQWTVLRFEFARVMTHERVNARERLSDGLLRLLDGGMQIPFATYRAALATIADGRARIAPIVGRADAILTPAAAGEAPLVGVQTDLLFQRLWTALHLPAITLPGWRGDAGLPIGVQLVGAHGDDARLLAVARWAEDAIARR